MKTLITPALLIHIVFSILLVQNISSQVKDNVIIKVNNSSDKKNNQQKKSATSKKSKQLLPHQLPDFKDDCTRYYYWYYVNYLDTFQHPVIRKFIDSKTDIQDYDCFLEPFRQWESKNRKNLYCYALVDDYFRIMADIPLFKTKVAQYRKKLEIDENMYVDYTCFDSGGIPIDPEKTRIGNVISYDRLFLFYKIKNNQFRTFMYSPVADILLFPGHTAIIADILLHDKKNKIIIMVLLNKPYDYYTLLIYDYKYNLIIDDISFVNKYKYIKDEMNSHFYFEYKDKQTFLLGDKNGQLDEMEVWMWDPAPFIDFQFNEVSIVETMNIYKLFEWYDKMKIPYTKHKK